MGRGGEHGHIGTGLGDDDVRDEDGHARDHHEDVPGDAKGLDELLDMLGEPIDHRLLLIELSQILADHERVMRGAPAHEGVFELGDLVPHDSFRETGEDDRIAFPISKSIELSTTREY